MLKFAALACSHNRVTKTIHCLDSFVSGIRGLDDVRVDIYLTDDGSTDGTADAVLRKFPSATVVAGDGNLFWSGGMRVAWQAASQRDDYDFYIWINDDVSFDAAGVHAAIKSAVNSMQELGDLTPILVGCVLDPDTGAVAYSGVRQPNSVLRPLYFEMLHDPCAKAKCDTFNGNFVIVPRVIASSVGQISDRYVHGYGDYDYGLSAKRLGFSSVVLPDPVGWCSRNAWVPVESISRMTLIERWRRMTGPKLYPLGAWLYYTRRNAGPFWPVFFLRPYVEVLIPWAFSRLR